MALRVGACEPGEGGAPSLPPFQPGAHPPDQPQLMSMAYEQGNTGIKDPVESIRAPSSLFFSFSHSSSSSLLLHRHPSLSSTGRRSWRLISLPFLLSLLPLTSPPPACIRHSSWWLSSTRFFPSYTLLRPPLSSSPQPPLKERTGSPLALLPAAARPPPNILSMRTMTM